MKNVTVKEMAESLDKSDQFIRIAIQRGEYPFAVAVQSKRSKKYSYQISRAGLERYVRGEIVDIENIRRKLIADIERLEETLMELKTELQFQHTKTQEHE